MRPIFLITVSFFISFNTISQSSWSTNSRQRSRFEVTTPTRQQIEQQVWSQLPRKMLQQVISDISNENYQYAINGLNFLINDIEYDGKDLYHLRYLRGYCRLNNDEFEEGLKDLKFASLSGKAEYSELHNKAVEWTNNSESASYEDMIAGIVNEIEYGSAHKALRMVNELFNQGYENEDLYYLRGLIRLGLGFKEEAIKDLKTAALSGNEDYYEAYLAAKSGSEKSSNSKEALESSYNEEEYLYQEIEISQCVTLYEKPNTLSKVVATACDGDVYINYKKGDYFYFAREGNISGYVHIHEIK